MSLRPRLISSASDGPGGLEAGTGEVEAIRTSVLNIVSLKLCQGDGPAPETVTMEIETFNKLAGVAWVTWIATSLGQRVRQQLAASWS